MAAEKGRGYFAAAGTTLYFSNLKDGRQMMAASGPLTGPLEAVVWWLNLKITLRPLFGLCMRVNSIGDF